LNSRGGPELAPTENDCGVGLEPEILYVNCKIEGSVLKTGVAFTSNVTGIGKGLLTAKLDTTSTTAV
jgi:hypothetical protein